MQQTPRGDKAFRSGGASPPRRGCRVWTPPRSVARQVSGGRAAKLLASNSAGCPPAQLRLRRCLTHGGTATGVQAKGWAGLWNVAVDPAQHRAEDGAFVPAALHDGFPASPKGVCLPSGPGALVFRRQFPGSSAQRDGAVDAHAGLGSGSQTEDACFREISATAPTQLLATFGAWIRCRHGCIMSRGQRGAELLLRIAGCPPGDTGIPEGGAGAFCGAGRVVVPAQAGGE